MSQILNFLRANAGNILVIALIVALAAWVIVRHFKQKAQGGAACAGCPGCASCSSCPSAARKEGRA